MADGIRVRILGDSGPFSDMGKSIGYLLEVGGKRLLVDCGSPLFAQIGGSGLQTIDGLLITHAHDDHKRWFSDLALFFRYTPGGMRRLPLLTTDEIWSELLTATGPAIDISLSPDSERVVDLGFEEFIDLTPIGPAARYRVVRTLREDGASVPGVVGPDGLPVAADRAKIVISPRSGRARLLFREPAHGRWIEPATYYALGDPEFYDADPRRYGVAGAFAIEPINAASWHGLPTFGLRVSTPRETLVFSSDTHHDLALWERLTARRAPSRQGMSARDFDAARVIVGDINEFTEQTWGERRLELARVVFDDAVVIHDISSSGSIVHTDYDALPRTSLDPRRTLLTHSPDVFTSSWMLSQLDKQFEVHGRVWRELVDGAPLPINADFYHKDHGRYFVLYRDAGGSHAVFEHDGVLALHPAGRSGPGELRCRVTVYEDIGGRYFPWLDDDRCSYRLRPDNRVERVEGTATGSIGTLVEDLRPRLTPGGAERRAAES